MERNMTALLIAMGALIAATIVRAVLDPWAPLPDHRETADEADADVRARMMDTIALSRF
jgi:hypothetical protein